jgi:hypothetical protein
MALAYKQAAIGSTGPYGHPHHIEQVKRPAVSIVWPTPKPEGKESRVLFPTILTQAP